MTSHDQAAERAARIIRSASNLIRRDGYTRSPGYDSEAGHSIWSALCRATRCAGAGAGVHDDQCEQVQARVAGYLYLTGRAGTRAPHYMPNALISWEEDEHRQASHGAGRARQHRRGAQ